MASVPFVLRTRVRVTVQSRVRVTVQSRVRVIATSPSVAPVAATLHIARQQQFSIMFISQHLFRIAEVCCLL